MKTSTDLPIIYKEILKFFPNVNWEDGICIAYGDTVYSKNPIPPDIAVHEQVHLDQQAGISPDAWWKQYLESRDFRFRMELEAFQKQVVFINKTYKDRTKRFKRKHQLWHELSGPLYGNMVSFIEAQRLLR